MKNQIIIEMDMEIEDGLKLMRETQLRDEIYGYKINSLWVLERGINILHYCKEHFIGKKIILDMQKWGTDIPDIIKKQVEKVAPYVDELICCPMGAGSESLKMFAETCIDNNIKPICVLEMTHPESDSYLETDQIEKYKLPSYVYNILDDSIKYGIQDFVIPATKEPRIGVKSMLSNWYPNEFKGTVNLYTTGLKVQGGQTKPMIDFGVTKFIVGRAVYEAENPIKAVEDIYKEINEV